MRKFLIAASIAALAAGASAAQAETICKQDKTGRTVATVVGAGIGAILGNVIDGGRERTAGTLLGGVAGGVAANQLAKDNTRCGEAYGYYDQGGRWHANRISAGEARGYYDRDNRWVEGQPRGYYDTSNRWVAFDGSSETGGYTDRDGRWVRGETTGYYDARGRWVSTGVVARPGNVAYNSRDTRARASRIATRIERMRANGQLSRAESRRALADLASIKRDESRMRYSGGRFTANEENVIHQRLDNLGKVIREDRDDRDGRPG